MGFWVNLDCGIKLSSLETLMMSCMLLGLQGTWVTAQRKYMYLVMSRLECYFTPVFFLLLDKKASHYAEKQIKTFWLKFKQKIAEAVC